MSELFISLYLDEDVDVLLADLVRARGFSVTTTRDAGNLGAKDENQLAYAVEQGFVLFTHNRLDFETLAKSYFSNNRHLAGIVIAIRHPVHELARRLLIILNHVTADEMQNHLRYM